MSEPPSCVAPNTTPDLPSGGLVLPRILEALLTTRVGEPHGKSRGGWKSEIMFDTEDGLPVFREKCYVKAMALQASVETAKKRFIFRSEKDVYLKQARNDAQDKYVRLTVENFHTTLLHRWKLLTSAERESANAGGFKFEAFVYVALAAPPPPQFFRATMARTDRAKVQRTAYEAANSVSFGPITAHHLDIVHARRPDGEEFSVPNDNTTAQAMELDRQRAILTATAATRQQ
jgi:hypothetical protein